jgi:hypothetical protein
MKTQTNIRIESMPWSMDTLGVHIAMVQTTANGTHVYARPQPLTMTVLRDEDDGMQHAPLFHITHEEAQQFMDELYRAGIRPRDGAGSVGQLAAKDAHLADLRRLVFQNIPPIQS